jgi:hypothetical protein
MTKRGSHCDPPWNSLLYSTGEKQSHINISHRLAPIGTDKHEGKKVDS